MNNMEIKQGDKVRVSKDIPQFYRRYNSYRVFEVEHQVVDIEDGLALLDSIPVQYVTTIPTKYLIKVDAEAKEATAPTIKVGDRVCCYNVLHLKGSKKEDYMGIVTSITDMGIMVQLDNGGAMLSYRESDLELVQPKEQTEEDAGIRQMEAELDEFRKAELDRVLHPEKYYTYEVSVDNVAMDWQRYEADLAKEIALKIANKKMDNHPEEIGAYAVRVAKSVVENLKNKQI